MRLLVDARGRLALAKAGGMKMLWRSVRVLGLAYLGVCCVLLFFENAFVYRPSTAQENWEPAPLKDIEDVALFNPDRTHIHAWWPERARLQALLHQHHIKI